MDKIHCGSPPPAATLGNFLELGIKQGSTMKQGERKRSNSDKKSSTLAGQIPDINIGLGKCSLSDTDLSDKTRVNRAGAVTKLEIESKKKLESLFPNCPPEVIQFYWGECGGNVDQAVSNLLDNGYEIRLEDESTKTKAKTAESDPDPFGTFLRESVLDAGATAIAPPPGDTTTTAIIDGAWGGAPAEGETDSDDTIIDGAWGGAPAERDIESNNNDSSGFQNRRPRLSVSDCSECLNDGEDWVDLALSDNFVKKAVSIYGGKGAKNNFTRQDKQIRIPPTLAFDIFRLFATSVARKRKLAATETATTATNSKT